MVKFVSLILLKKINVKVFNLISRINETKQMLWHETCKCVCKLSSAIFNNNQIWNDDKYRYECKEDLVNKINCYKGYSWNPSNCQCECDKYCDTGEYLDYKSCTCKQSIIDKLIDECTNTSEENNDILVAPSGNNIYYILFIMFIVLPLISINVLIYFYWYNEIAFKKKKYYK